MANSSAPAEPGRPDHHESAIDDITPATWRYLASLPASIRLTGCARLFPRIVNRCAELSLQPERLDAYLRSLVVDERGGRAGFPMEILTELSQLRDHLMRTRPDRYKVYDLVMAADGSLRGTWHSSERRTPDAVPVVASGEAQFDSVAELFAMAGVASRSPTEFQVEIYVDGERVLPIG